MSLCTILPPVSLAESARERILDAAFVEMRLHGYQAASIARILASTGLTKGALYHYFPSKKALGLAVVDERVAAALAVSVLDGLRVVDEGQDALGCLLAVLDRSAGWSDEDLALGCPLNNLMQEMSPVDEDFRCHLVAVMALWRERLEALLRAAQARGQLAPALDCAGTALFILAAWEGAISVAKSLRSAEVFAQAIEPLKAYVRHLAVAGGAG
jgi:TetR/AcrR family transcriptional regulator, transcriptional repressor for nem operon